MPPGSPNYYEVLGLLPTATPNEIKRRYHELARRYHPDVAAAPDASERFKEINEANTVLSDPGKRANYDAHLKLEELKRQPPDKREEGKKAGTEARADAPRPASRPATATHRPAAPASPTTTADEAGRILREAQRAMSRLKFREAEMLARRANKIRRSSLGYEILGDTMRSRGRNDEAVAMYSYALQLDRSNHDVQRKFDRLVGQRSGPTMSGTAARASRRTAPSPKPSSRVSSVAATALGLVALAALLIASSRIGSPATGPWLLDFDGLYIFALACSGTIVGFLLALLGGLPSARTELFVSAPRAGRSPSFPVGPIVIGFSFLNFYAALLVFLVMGFLTDRLQKSLVLTFAAAFAITLVFAMVNVSAASWTLLSGAGVSLIGCLAGWCAASVISTEAKR